MKPNLKRQLASDELWSLYSTDDTEVRNAAIDEAESLLEKILQSQSKDRKHRVWRFLQLLLVAQKSASTRYHSLLVSFLESIDTFCERKLKCGDDVSDALEMIGIGPKKRAMLLIEARDHLPSMYFGIVADAARKWLKASQFYEMFSVYVKPKAKGKSDDAIRHQAVIDSLSREEGPLWSYDDFREGKENKSRLDTQWLDLALEKNIDWLVVELASRSNKKSLAFIEKEWESYTKKDPFDLFPIVEALARTKHPRAREALLAVLEGKALSRRYDPDYQQWMYLLSYLPKSTTKAVEELLEHPKCNDQARVQIPYWLTRPFGKYFDPDPNIPF